MRQESGSSHAPQFRHSKIGTAIALALMVGAPAAFAFEFKSGEVTGSFDTTISFGTSWRMQGRDPALVSIMNGGTSRSPNEDDGNLNYGKNDAFSSPFKVTHELALKRNNLGLFARGSYFYDFAYQNQDVSAVTGFGQRGKDRLGADAEMLDMFVYGSFDVGGRKLNGRLGQQLVSWGESTFIPNGINIVNPVDVAKLRSPGADLKDALLPTPMIWASQELSDTVTVEGFYLTNFNKVRIDPRGSYFSSSDILSDDADKAFIGFGRRLDQHFPYVMSGTTGSLNNLIGQVWLPRLADRNPKDSGQYGFAARLFLPELNNTELGFYHANYHSRTPFASGIKGTSTNVLAPGTARYFAEYPEDIRLWGASFNTAGPGGVALQGEYSYRPNQPLQLSSIELLLAGLGLSNNITGSTVIAPGNEISGYRRVEMHQLQFTGTKAFGPTFGAEQLAVVGEVGYTYLDLPSNLLFNGPGVFLPAPGSFDAANGSFQREGYATRNSWGYRLLAKLDYPNAIAGGTLSPRIAFSHDVDGVSPTFNQGVKAMTIGLGFNFRQSWQADIAYTTYWGGRTYSGTDSGAGANAYTAIAGQSPTWASSANPLKDRDFLSASLSYAF